MIRTVLIDDERKNLLNLQRLLEKYCPEILIEALAANAGEGIEKIRTFNPDLIFLDIQMPDKNGFEMLKELDAYNFEVIFVTAFDQYGLQAIKFSAIDYLLKPVNIDELKLAVRKAGERISMKKLNDRLENLMQLIANDKDRSHHKIAISSIKEIRFVEVSEIIRCESENSYTNFFLASGENIMSTTPIYEYEQLLTDYGFVRTHQSHLANRIFVKSLRRDEGYYLLMTDGSQIPVSRQKRDEVRSRLH